MKRRTLFSSLSLAVVLLALICCTKSTTNNYTTKIVPLPAFTVSGLRDMTLQNGNTGLTTYLQVGIDYTDSAQESVKLSLSGLPDGIVIDTTWIRNGIPSFTTDIVFYDTTAGGATPGTYPLTFTATGSTSGSVSLTFNLIVKAAVSCSQGMLGKYTNCTRSCTGGGYVDSVYADPSVVNKIWFSNFEGTGAKVYGIFNCSSSAITIPSQVVSGVTISGNGNGSSSGFRYISLEVDIDSTFCGVTMQQ